MYRRKKTSRRSRRVKTRRTSLAKRRRPYSKRSVSRKRGSRRRLLKSNGMTNALKMAGAATALLSNMYTPSQTVTETGRKRKSTTVAHATQELSRSKRSIRIKPYSLKKVLSCISDKRVERFQGLSNFDTNVGYTFIDNYVNSVDNQEVESPMLIFNLGQIYQPTLGEECRVCTKHVWQDSTPLAQSFGSVITGQTADGTSVSPNWQIEHNDKFSSSHDSIILNWISVRLNLYGARNRTTRFTVTFFKVKDERTDVSKLGNPGWASSDPEFQNNIQAYERPYIFSNIQQDAFGKKKGNWKIIKEFNYVIEPSNTFDLNTTTGKIHEANIFLKVNEKLDFLYADQEQTLGHLVADGVDFVSESTLNSLHTQPVMTQNIFMMIRAFAPERCYKAGGPPPTRGAGVSPSIDFLIRRGMTMAE